MVICIRHTGIGDDNLKGVNSTLNAQTAHLFWENNRLIKHKETDVSVLQNSDVEIL